MRYCSRYFKTSHVIVYLLTMLLSSFFLRYFKTSHVIVYHSVCGIVYSGKENFKTSHVIVYHYAEYEQLVGGVFQNISCYCLSKAVFADIMGLSSFQNISCYCLSFHGNIIINLLLFQNISCYCLSFPGFYVFTLDRISKHLMLLFILNQCLGLSGLQYFKTSHVIVYPYK